MSSNVESSKTLAAIGAILLFLSFIPVVGIIGIILVLIGMKGLSEYYKDESIYRNALKGVIFGIIGIIAVSVGSILAFLGGMFSTSHLERQASSADYWHYLDTEWSLSYSICLWL